MEPHRNYVRVGGFVLLGLLTLIFFSVWLTGASDKRAHHFYQVKFHESVSGLTVGSPVKYRGVSIGTVDDIDIDLAEPNTIVARMRVTKGVPIKKDTVATLKLQGITGASFVELSGGEAGEADIEGSSVNVGTLPEIPSKFSSIAALSNDMPEIINKTSYFATQAGRLVSDENLALTNDILKKWDRISGILESETAQMESLIKNMSELAQTTNRVMTQIDGGEVKETLLDLHDTARQLKELAQTTNAASQSSVDDAHALLLDARKTSQSLRDFTKKLGENPSQILFAPQEKEISLP